MSPVAKLLARLVAHHTHNPGGNEVSLAMLLAKELKARRPDTVRLVEVPRAGAIGAYVLATWGTPRLLVNAHLDTVPPNDGWTGDPYVARVSDDRLTALGAADTKGAIAAILCALDELSPRDTAVLFSGDEELDNTCMRAFLAAPPIALGAGGVTRAIVCEPTSLQVGVRHRGIVSAEIALKGQGGHSSRADVLPRPLAELARLAAAIDDWGRAHVTKGPPGFLGMCLNIAKLDGGIAFNVIPERGTLTLSLRPPPGADVAAIKAELGAIQARIVPSAQTTWLIDSPPFETREVSAFEPLLGARARAPRDLAFWTEAALLARAGVDAVVIGPGDINHAHAGDEHVLLAELEAARTMFADVWRSTRDGAG